MELNDKLVAADHTHTRVMQHVYYCVPSAVAYAAVAGMGLMTYRWVSSPIDLSRTIVPITMVAVLVSQLKGLHRLYFDVCWIRAQQNKASSIGQGIAEALSANKTRLAESLFQVLCDQSKLMIFGTHVHTHGHVMNSWPLPMLGAIAASQDDLDLGRTPLHEAALDGQWTVVQALVQLGAKLDDKDDLGQTPLHLAAAMGRLEVVKILASHRELVNIRDSDDRTPLHHAARRGQVKVIKVLGECRAAFDVVDSAGNTPLCLALVEGKPKAATALVDIGLPLDSESEQALIMLRQAAGLGHLDLVGALVNKGVDVNGKDERGFTALHQAAYKGDWKTVIGLIRLGANKEVVDDMVGRTPLHFAATRSCRDTSFAAAALVWFGAMIDPKDDQGRTPLHLAAARVDPSVAKTLLLLGANVNAKDNNGQMPLHRAVSHGSNAVIQILVACGAEIRVQDLSRRTPLQYAEMEGRWDIAHYLHWRQRGSVFTTP